MSGWRHSRTAVIAVAHCVLTYCFVVWSMGWQMALLDEPSRVKMVPVGLHIVSATAVVLSVPVLLPFARLALAAGFADPIHGPVYWPLPIINSPLVANLAVYVMSRFWPRRG